LRDTWPLRLFCFSLTRLAQSASPGTGGEIRVNSNVSMSQSINAGDEDAITKAQTAARKAGYERAGEECKLLLDTIAGACRLESLNVNSNVQNQMFRGDSPNVIVNTSSNAVFQITLK